MKPPKSEGFKTDPGPLSLWSIRIAAPKPLPVFDALLGGLARRRFFDTLKPAKMRPGSGCWQRVATNRYKRVLVLTFGLFSVAGKLATPTWALPRRKRRLETKTLFESRILF